MKNHNRFRIEKLNNEGVTLVELIVVIAIISAMSAAIIMGSSFLTKSRVKKAYSILQSEYSEARNNTMTKMTASDLILSKVDNKYYIQVGDQDKTEWIGSPYTVYYDTCNASGNKVKNHVELTGDVTVSFKRATGAMECVFPATNEYLTAVYIDSMALYFVPDSGKYSTEEL